MSYNENNPYYRGTTYQEVFQFVDIVEGKEEPANLNIPGITFEMHVRYAPEVPAALVVIDTDKFALGKSNLNVDKWDELSIEMDAEDFEVVPTSLSLVRDIFAYLPDGKRIVLLKNTPLPVEYNVTQKEFNNE